MSAKWAAFQQPKGSRIDGNDANHGRSDPNGGGSPVIDNAKVISNAHRGGPYQSGQRQYTSTSIHGGRGGSGNPASRGGTVQHETPDARVPGHGGSPQQRSNIPPPSNRGGFGHSGQSGVPTIATNPQPGAGNTGGKMAKRITGRFNNSSKGPRSGGNVGSYGDRAPVTAST